MTDFGELGRAGLRRALGKLDVNEQVSVLSNARRLRDALREDVRNPAGEGTCLEILAAIGRAINEGRLKVE